MLVLTLVASAARVIWVVLRQEAIDSDFALALAVVLIVAGLLWPYVRWLARLRK